jgi:tRNA (guanine37-N1)-methyltransferase
MRIDVVTIFPGLFEPVLGTSMLGIARDRGLLDVRVHDLREWALPGVHRQVDDAPYGGGPGMVMRPEPFFAAVRQLLAEDATPAIVVLLCPQGQRLAQPIVESLAPRERLIVLCGRYEGFDERIRTLADIQLSIGDYVLTGGELPAMVLIDAVCRLIPGVLDEDSATEESFTLGLLEYPQYTRPQLFEDLEVPEVLRSGDHARIRLWRRVQAIERTAALRPDLLDGAELTQDERALADRLTDSSAQTDADGG